MELEVEDGASAGNSTITVFGTDRTDLKKLGTVRREIHVALLDPRTDAQFLYPATILHSGLLPASDASAGGISFSPRRFAYRKGRQFATLQPLGSVDPAVLNAAEYFVTVHLGGLEPGLRVVVCACHRKGEHAGQRGQQERHFQIIRASVAKRCRDGGVCEIF